MTANEDVTGINFGFNFDVIVNTNDSGQGSLRQFIINANAIGNATIDQRQFDDAGTARGTNFPAEQETSIFMIANGNDLSGLSGLPNYLTNAAGGAATSNSRALITLTSALPAITDAKTYIDGSTQTTLTNSNNGTALGTVTTVGTEAKTLTTLARPEVEISINAGITNGITFSASNCALRNVAVHGGAASVRVDAGTSFLIENSGLGIDAFSVAAPATNPTSGVLLQLLNATGTVQNNIIAYAGNSGINYSAGSGSAGYTIRQNEFAQNGRTTAGGDNISVGDNGVAGPLLIEENLIRDANSSGLQFEIGQVSNNIVRNNTISGNGKGGFTTRLEGSGIHYLQRNGSRVGTNTDLLTKNIITSNQSSGVVVNYGQRNVQITQNSIYGNGDGTTGGQGLVAIDYTPADYRVGGNQAYGQGDGVTPNDGLLNVNEPNGGMDYPVITRKLVYTTNGGTTTNLRVVGYVGSNFGQATFGGTTVEVFLGDNVTDNNQNGPIIVGDGQSQPHGEPKTFIGSFVTGADGSFDEILTFPTNTFTPALTIADPINALAFKAGYGTSEAGNNLIPNTLPVVLTSFTAQAEGSVARLTWRTAQELNNDHFEVERSSDAFVTFEKVGTVRGQGSTTVATTYRFDDRVAAQGLVYYRLRQVDNDGTATLSEVRTVTIKGKATAEVTLSPNPATSVVYLDLASLAGEKYTVTVTDMAGRRVLSQVVSRQAKAPLAIDKLQAGTYLLSIDGADAHVVKRLVKQD